MSRLVAVELPSGNFNVNGVIVTLAMLSAEGYPMTALGALRYVADSQPESATVSYDGEQYSAVLQEAD